MKAPGGGALPTEDRRRPYSRPYSRKHRFGRCWHAIFEMEGGPPEEKKCHLRSCLDLRDRAMPGFSRDRPHGKPDKNHCRGFALVLSGGHKPRHQDARGGPARTAASCPVPCALPYTRVVVPRESMARVPGMAAPVKVSARRKGALGRSRGSKHHRQSVAFTAATAQTAHLR